MENATKLLANKIETDEGDILDNNLDLDRFMELIL